eukprot:TRINITY_DN13879_c0_g3_i2.p1 TRINITY_DN13879_c0_g3~~TRINITY_DN13879_c0_g3_i2.p1  ORF type:complete len:582 (-),score=75.47 TRINITY_DN13879_c0_g3_i2:14-1516(-)
MQRIRLRNFSFTLDLAENIGACASVFQLWSLPLGNTVQVTVVLFYLGTRAFTGGLLPKNNNGIQIMACLLYGGTFLNLVNSSAEVFWVRASARSVVRILGSLLLLDFRKSFFANLLISLTVMWQASRAVHVFSAPNLERLLSYTYGAETLTFFCVCGIAYAYERCVLESISVRLELEESEHAKQTARKLLSAAYDADLCLDSELRFVSCSESFHHLLMNRTDFDERFYAGTYFPNYLLEHDGERFLELANACRSELRPATAMEVYFRDAAGLKVHAELLHVEIVHESSGARYHLLGIKEMQSEEMPVLPLPDTPSERRAPLRRTAYRASNALSDRSAGSDSSSGGTPSVRASEELRHRERHSQVARPTRLRVTKFPIRRPTCDWNLRRLTSTTFTVNLYSNDMEIKEVTYRFSESRPGPRLSSFFSDRSWPEVKAALLKTAMSLGLGEEPQDLIAKVVHMTMMGKDVIADKVLLSESGRPRPEEIQDRNCCWVRLDCAMH